MTMGSENEYLKQLMLTASHLKIRSWAFFLLFDLSSQIPPFGGRVQVEYPRPDKETVLRHILPVMFKFGVMVLLLVYCPPTSADTCNVCKTAYGTPAAGAKCAALKTYLTCLETSAKGDAGCPLPNADAGTIETDFTGDNCTFTDTCVCQKEFWKTDQSADDAAVCSAAQTYIACLKGKTALACDGTSSVTTLATGVENRMKALTTPACAITTACQCEIDAAKADISTDAKKCTAYKAQYACLYPLTTAPCASGTTIADLKTAVATSVTTATSCTFDDTCVCQRTFDAATKGTDAEKCTAYKDELSCLRTAQSPGCDGTTTKSAIATASETARAALPTVDCPALTSTCQCEVDAAKGAAATSATYCTVLTTLKTCLSAITTTTEAGCTSTTQAGLLTDTNTKITAATCGSAADHVTFATTSLIVSVLVNMFL